MFRVEISIQNEQELPGRMAEMRTWLDHQRFEPDLFRCTTACSGVICRVEFKVEAEAAAFAEAFGGTVRRLIAMN